jgi:hypothetical protein
MPDGNCRRAEFKWDSIEVVISIVIQTSTILKNNV